MKREKRKAKKKERAGEKKEEAVRKTGKGGGGGIHIEPKITKGRDGVVCALVLAMSNF